MYDTSHALAVGGMKIQNTKYTFYRRKCDGELFCLQEELDKQGNVWTTRIIAQHTYESAHMNIVPLSTLF